MKKLEFTFYALAIIGGFITAVLGYSFATSMGVSFALIIIYLVLLFVSERGNQQEQT